MFTGAVCSKRVRVYVCVCVCVCVCVFVCVCVCVCLSVSLSVSLNDCKYCKYCYTVIGLSVCVFSQSTLVEHEDIVSDCAADIMKDFSFS